MKHDDGWLVALWLLIGGLTGGLSYVNPTHFVSPDSTYYLSFAGWLVGLDGNQYGHISESWDGTFPLGYPLLIGTLARLTGTSLLVASKLLNVLLTGVFLLIWRRRIGARRTLWVGSVLLLGGSLRLLSYTWSEWAFLILLIEWAWFLSRVDWKADPLPASERYRFIAKLFLLTSGLFLLRYVGGYVVIVYGLLALGAYWRVGWPLNRQRLQTDLLYGVGSAAFMLGYFYLNSLLTPSVYGGDRFYETSETMGDKLYLIALAPINEVLLLRDHIPNEPVLLVVVGVLVQAVLCWWIWPRLTQHRATLPNWLPADQQALRVLLVSAATYLTILFTMRLFSPFNGPNARLMAPVTLPLLVLLLGWISRWNNILARRQLGYWWFALLLCSWLQLLPQADLWGKLTTFFGM